MLTPGELWIAAGLLGCAAEMAAPGVFLLPIGLAAVGTGLLTMAAGLAGPGQVAAFLALTAALAGAAVLRARQRPVQVDPLNGPAAGLVGRTCRALAFEAEEGRVSLGDGTWPARTTDGAAPPPGAVLHVVGLDGTTLLVAAEPAWSPAGAARMG